MYKRHFETVIRQDVPLVKPTSKFIFLIKEMRIEQWPKNGFVFAAILFSNNIFKWHLLSEVFLGCIAFCLMSSVVYIINDIFDVQKDREHPEKCRRPIACGVLPVKQASVWASLLLIGSLFVALQLNDKLLLILLIYLITNIAYTIKLKCTVLVDVMIVSFGFVLRAVSGAVLINVELTPWFLICNMLLSLFIALTKRRHELTLFEKCNGSGRDVLAFYSTQLLDQLISIVTATTIMAYALYTFTSNQPKEMIATLPFVIYGIFRYLYLVHMKDGGGNPEKTLFEDKPLFITVVLYCFTVIIILHFY